MNLLSEESCVVGNSDVFVSAGIAKLPIIVEAFRQIDAGILKKNNSYYLKETDKVPSLGALNNLHESIELTIEDLYKLMIIVSDNTATNILIEILGIHNINHTMAAMGFDKTRIERKFFDKKKAAEGFENKFSLVEMGELLRRLYHLQVISSEFSQEIINILKEQQRNNIIPYYFEEEMPIAHLQGADFKILHNIGIVFSENPFIICMGSNDVNTRKLESIMRDIALMCYNHANK
ncbi:serine hydrolase [Aminipila butyrica]|uniref:Serine hydrolase n=1 Tax=Aminipila butyrica TaxID=433296 RepID=A0A858BXF3_9FIRM|nr:serine hydrolase [Aminipila butyrica]QIB70633.1 serine hydrolase [Aminipila butyrica]